MAEPTMQHLPATWTPAPTATPAPPTATPTLVVQGTPIIVPAGSAAARRYPEAASGKIGMWAETAHLAGEYVGMVASRVQIISGPLALAAARRQPQLLTLARAETAAKTDQLLPDIGALARRYDAVLLPQGQTPAPGARELQATALREAAGTRLLIVEAGWAPTGSTDQSAVDGICFCDFLRSAAAAPDMFKGEAEWMKEVDALAQASRAGSLLVLVATPFDKTYPEPEQYLAAWFDYALASYLLAAQGSRTFFSFQGPGADDYMSNGELDTALGYPLGDYYQSYGLYIRRYQRGWVVVNAGAGVRDIPLWRTFASATGQQVIRATLPPHTGQILLTVQ